MMTPPSGADGAGGGPKREPPLTRPLPSPVPSALEGCLLADGFDDAIIGWTDSWSGGERPSRAVYDATRCIEILVAGGMTDGEAFEYFEFNVAGAYVGPGTPVFVWPFSREA